MNSKHNIIILFEAVKFEVEIETFENGLLQLRNFEKFDIFYLKINTAPLSSAYSDICHEVKLVNGKAVIGRTDNDLYYFRNSASLKNCIKKNVNPPGDEFKTYFFSIGHGRGFGFFADEKDIKKNGQSSAFDILWNYELATALEGLNVELAVFNNCNVTFLDTLLRFSDSCLFMIGTENYLTPRMFHSRNIIQEIISREGHTSTIHFTRQLFATYLSTSLAAYNSNGINQHDYSLYNCYLGDIGKFNDALNELLIFLNANFQYYSLLIKNARQAIYSIGSNFDSIDLFEFLNRIRLLNKDKKLNSLLEKILDFNTLVVYNGFCLSEETRLHGIAVYFPDITKLNEEDLYYSEYMKTRAPAISKEWYKLLDNVKK